MRFITLDFYRFVASLSIVKYHFKSTIFDSKIATFDFGAQGMFVDFFFILSGFVISYNYADINFKFYNYQKFIFKRLARIYPLHFMMLFIYLTIYYFENIKFSWYDFFNNLILTQSWGFTSQLSFNAPSWSISSEFFCYIFFPIILILSHKQRIFISVSVVIVIYYYLTRSWFPLWQQDGFFGANFDFGMIRAFPSFLVGCLIHRIFLITPYRRKYYILIGFIFFLCSIFSIYYYVRPNFVMILFVMTIYTTALGDFSFNGKMPFGNVLRTTGDISYGCYMIHASLLKFFIHPVWIYLNISDSWLAMLLLLSIILICALSYFIFRFFEMPARYYLTHFQKIRLS